MKKFLTVLIFTGLSIVCSFGQEQPLSDRVTGSSGYSVGINTQFMLDGLFDQNTMTPLELMVRKRRKADQAMRARLGGMATHSNRINADEELESRQTNWNAALGYEWHESLGKKFGFYYGVDGEAAFGNLNTVFKSRYFNTAFGYLATMQKLDFTESSYSINPVIGGTYQLSRRLYASAELRFKILFKQDKRNFITKQSAPGYPPDFFVDSYSSIQNFQFDLSFIPLANIFIHFKF